MENPLVFFLFYLEEGLAVTFLGPALFGLRPGLKKAAAAGIIQGCMIYLVRNLLGVFHAPPLAHSFLLLALLIIITRYVNGAGWGISGAASLLSSLCLIISELILLPVFFHTFNITWSKVYASLWLHIFSGYLGDMLFFAVTIAVAASGFSFLKFRQITR